MPETTRTYVLAQRPSGRPSPETFQLVERDRRDPDAGEVELRVIYLSVDPYMRDRMSPGESYSPPWAVGEPLQGGAVAEVVAEDSTDHAVGDLVVGNLEWSDYVTVAGDAVQPVDTGEAPLSTALGVLGMPGRTAYFGTTEVAEPGPGDTFVVTGAAGAVGSVAGQIAKLSGAEVVGFAGSDEKVQFLEEELGFDAGINYKTTDDYGAALDEAAPDGVDAYFDNVGGEITDAVFTRLNVDARVAICGQIALYNAEELPTGPRKLPGLIETRARVEGFLVRDFAARYEQATERLAGWVADGEIAYRETIADGLESAPDAFLGLFDGENVGKQLVQVGPEP